MSYKAWVRENGTYGTQAQGFRRWNDEILGEANRLMSDQWMELFIYFKEQIDETRKFIGHKLTELRSQFGGVYSPNIRVLLSRPAEMRIRSSSLSDFDSDVNIERARNHVFTTRGNRGNIWTVPGLQACFQSLEIYPNTDIQTEP